MTRQPARPRSPRAPATISASEFKATCLELIDEIARTDADVIVTKHARPVVRVSAVQTPFESPWGFICGSVVSHGDIISPDRDTPILFDTHVWLWTPDATGARRVADDLRQGHHRLRGADRRYSGVRCTVTRPPSREATR